MNPESRVFMLRIFDRDDRKPHRYPAFGIYPIEAFCFLSLEDCINKISEYSPDDNLYCFIVEAHYCGVDMCFGIPERWLFLPDGTLYAHTFPDCSIPLERNFEYRGRKPEECHFEEGDFVEMLTRENSREEDTVTLGIVWKQPPTPARIEKFRKERGMSAIYIGGEDDRYIILVDTFKDDGGDVYRQCGPLASSLLPPSMPIPAKYKNRLLGLLERVKKEVYTGNDNSSERSSRR